MPGAHPAQHSRGVSADDSSTKGQKSGRSGGGDGVSAPDPAACRGIGLHVPTALCLSVHTHLSVSSGDTVSLCLSACVSIFSNAFLFIHLLI